MKKSDLIHITIFCKQIGILFDKGDLESVKKRIVLLKDYIKSKDI